MRVAEGNGIAARDSPRVAEATAECRQRAQADPPREYPLAEGDPKGTLVGVQRL